MKRNNYAVMGLVLLIGVMTTPELKAAGGWSMVRQWLGFGKESAQSAKQSAHDLVEKQQRAALEQADAAKQQLEGTAALAREKAALAATKAREKEASLAVQAKERALLAQEEARARAVAAREHGLSAAARARALAAEHVYQRTAVVRDQLDRSAASLRAHGHAVLGQEEHAEASEVEEPVDELRVDKRPAERGKRRLARKSARRVRRRVGPRGAQ